METGITPCYCAGGNSVLTQIAYEEGFLLGSRSDKWHYPYKLDFIDVDYKQPDFEKHLRRVAKEQPRFATVPDLSEDELSLADIDRALTQAERLRQYCEVVLLVPKLKEQLALIPVEWAIAYSVPTNYGGAKYSPQNLTGRRVHLLGGSPHAQWKCYRWVASAGGQVISVDGNMAQKLAVEKLKYWRRGGREGGQWLDWYPRGKENKDEYPNCFRQSCKNIYKLWKGTDELCELLTA